MVVTLEFEHNGQISRYEFPDGTTLQIPGAPPFITMTCMIQGLNVRQDRSTANPPVAQLDEGQQILVSAQRIKEGSITWRHIYQPANLTGNWVAESMDGDERVYLTLPGTTASAPKQVKVEPEKPEQQTSQSTTPQAPDNPNAPMPLTGNIQLVQQTDAHGTYTALAINGDAKPKMGVNVREFAYFGTPQWQWTNQDGMPTYAKTAQELGMRWFRFFAPHRDAEIEVVVEKVRHALDVLAQHNLLAVVCLGDSIAEAGLFPRGDDQWHTASMGHLDKSYFNGGHYKTNYWPVVQRLVTEFKEHPGVGMWQLKNEMAIYNPPASDSDLVAFEQFVDSTSQMIYEIDSTHPISIGFINTAHIMPPGRDLRQFSQAFFRARKYIHVGTSHVYQYDNNGDPNAKWEHEEFCALDQEITTANGRAFLWTEFGASQAGSRVQATQRFLNTYVINGRGSGALQWGFMLNTHGIEDTGVGDARYGFSKAGFNKEYAELATLFKQVSS